MIWYDQIFHALKRLWWYSEHLCCSVNFGNCLFGLIFQCNRHSQKPNESTHRSCSTSSSLFQFPALHCTILLGPHVFYIPLYSFIYNYVEHDYMRRFKYKCILNILSPNMMTFNEDVPKPFWKRNLCATGGWNLKQISRCNRGAPTLVLGNTFGSSGFDHLPQIKQNKAINKYNSIAKYVRYYSNAPSCRQIKPRKKLSEWTIDAMYHDRRRNRIQFYTSCFSNLSHWALIRKYIQTMWDGEIIIESSDNWELFRMRPIFFA